MTLVALLGTLSNVLIYVAIACYALALVAYAADAALVGRPTRSLVLAGGHAGAGAAQSVPHTGIAGAGTTLTCIAFSSNLLAVVARGIAAQRAPWGNMYEFAMVIALAVGASYLTLLARAPVRQFGVWVVSLVLLTLGLAVTVLYTPVDALVPVLDSYWLVVHVAAAITAGGVFTLGALGCALGLLRTRYEARPTTTGALRGRYARALPSADTLRRVAHRAHVFAFPVWTFAVIAGAIWAENAWGRYWGWDPKETWAFITWVLYAAYLHAESTPGWRGTRAAWFALAGYAAFVFNFFGVNLWISGLHSYAGV